MHPGVLVDPPSDLGRGPLPFELGRLGVDTRSAVAFGGQTLRQVATGAVEHHDPFPACRDQQGRFMADELGTNLVVETSQYSGHGVDMVTRDHTRRQGLLERGHRITRVGAAGDADGVTGRTVAFVTEQRFGRLGFTGGGEFGGAPRATHVDRRQPRPQLR